MKKLLLFLVSFLAIISSALIVQHVRAERALRPLEERFAGTPYRGSPLNLQFDGKLDQIVSERDEWLADNGYVGWGTWHIVVDDCGDCGFYSCSCKVYRRFDMDYVYVGRWLTR